MLHRRSFARAAGAALLSASLAACSLLGGPWSARHEPEPPAAPPAPPQPTAAMPVATYKFTVAPDDDVVGVVQTTHAAKEDTLTDIARRFNLGYEEIVRANPGVDVWIPGAGRKIVLPTQFILPDVPRKGIVINIAAMRLYYFPPHKAGEPQVVYTHPIGIGRVGWRTPTGVTRIIRREKNPTWHPPPSIIKEHREEGDQLPAVVGPGPDNPLGDRAFYLAWPGYLIHGTNKPAGVGLRVSHGCIHLFPEDIEALFEQVPVGTQVRVINEPYVFGWHDGQLYMQAFGSLEDDHRDWSKAQQKLLAKSLGRRTEKALARHGEQVSWDVVMQLARTPRGVPVAVTRPDASVEQVLTGALEVQNVLPEGATWDGRTDLPMDEATFKQVVSENDAAERESAAAPQARAAVDRQSDRPASVTPASAGPASSSPAQEGDAAAHATP
jgi:L,D-transpeptidase ErfK/SrfK